MGQKGKELSEKQLKQKRARGVTQMVEQVPTKQVCKFKPQYSKQSVGGENWAWWHKPVKFQQLGG
jgi:hypothetical protein